MVITADDWQEPLGKEIQAARREHGWSVAELADRLGVSAGLVHAWEASTRRVTEKHAEALTDVLGIQFDPPESFDWYGHTYRRET